MRVATAQQMRAIDRFTIDQCGVPGAVLMENAGRAVFDAVCELMRERGIAGPVAVVCGKGNNGGDGMVAARWLRNKGHEVKVALLCRGDELSGDAALNYAAAKAFGVEIIETPTADDLRAMLAQAAVIVDAVLGTGIRGEVTGPARAAIELMNEAAAPVVSVDIPSGVNADTGAICGVAVRAEVTVTFGLPKVGNVVYPGAGWGGRLIVADISLAPHALDNERINTWLIDAELAAKGLPRRFADMHKGDAGRVLVVAGSRGYTGAAALAAMGALRAGAGLVFVACPASVNDVLEVKCTEAITLPMPETAGGALAVGAADAILEAAAGCDAVAIGPGMGRDAATAELVEKLVSQIDAPVIIDADGLNCLAQVGTGVLEARTGPAVITPHPGELSRLLDVSIAEIQSDRLGWARRAAEQLGAVAVLKGAGTIVARPDGEAYINSSGSPALATGGTGDVLTGMIAAFIAGGSDPDMAAAAAVYYHGVAGELAASEGSERAVIAGDLLRWLPRALARSCP